MVEVFITNVQERERAKDLTRQLQLRYPHFKINFDLEDRDKILRVEGKQVSVEKIVDVIKENGFQCQVLMN